MEENSEGELFENENKDNLNSKIELENSNKKEEEEQDNLNKESLPLIEDNEILDDALTRLKVDKLGLDETDYNLLLSIIERFNGGPVGIEAIASSIGEEVSTIEDVYEPYLLQQGYLKRTSRGRMVTDKAYQHLGIKNEKDSK